MIKCFLFILVTIILVSCNNKPIGKNDSARQIDSLEKVISNSYKPGLGEFMLGIQTHHSKLWFAGKAENWELADFEMQEIKELFDDVKKYTSDREETKLVPMIYPALDSLSASVARKDKESFSKVFYFLTEKCNSCHQSVKHGFNVIVVPETSPFSNQDFKKQ